MKRADLVTTAGKVAIDFLAIFCALLTAYWLRFSEAHTWFGLNTPSGPIDGFTTSAFAVSVGMMFLFIAQGVYNRQRRFITEIKRLFWALTAGFGLVLLYFFLGRIFFFSRFVFGVAWILSFTYLVLGRGIIRLIRLILVRNNIGKTRILFVGSGRAFHSLQSILMTSPYYEIVAQTDSADAIEPLLERETIDTVLLAAPGNRAFDKNQIMSLCHRYHCLFQFLPDEVDLDLSDTTSEEIGGFPVLTLHAHNHRGLEYILKNMLDRIGAATGLVLLSPICIYVALRLKYESPDADIFYVSKRVGKSGVPFPCIKFRSMRPNADLEKDALDNDRDGVFFKKEDDPRITPFGAFIRKTSLDELPQLVNVLKGDMSLVGPRPHIPEEVEKYHLDDVSILSVKPGITGWAAVNGRSNNSYVEEMNLERYYLQNWSLILDAYILWRTIIVVLRQENVS